MFYTAVWSYKTTYLWIRRLFCLIKILLLVLYECMNKWSYKVNFAQNDYYFLTFGYQLKAGHFPTIIMVTVKFPARKSIAPAMKAGLPLISFKATQLYFFSGPAAFRTGLYNRFGFFINWYWIFNYPQLLCHFFSIRLLPW